jgi:hypothetical protein
MKTYVALDYLQPKWVTVEDGNRELVVKCSDLCKAQRATEDDVRKKVEAQYKGRIRKLEELVLFLIEQNYTEEYDVGLCVEGIYNLDIIRDTIEIEEGEPFAEIAQRYKEKWERNDEQAE